MFIITSLTTVIVTGILVAVLYLDLPYFKIVYAKYKTMSWPSVEGEIIESLLAPKTTRESPVHLTYKFQVEGRSYTSQTFSFDPFMPLEDDIVAYPVGPITVYYNPLNPNQSILSRDSSRLSGLLMTSPLIFGFYWALAVYIFGDWLFLPLTITSSFMLSICLIGYGLRLRYLNYQVASWPSVEGKIVKSLLVTHDEGSSTAHFTYRFYVDGRSYVSKNFSYGSSMSEDIQVAMYPVGSTTVYYKPTNPQQSVLNHDRTKKGGDYVLGGSLLLIFSSYLFYLFYPQYLPWVYSVQTLPR